MNLAGLKFKVVPNNLILTILAQLHIFYSNRSSLKLQCSDFKLWCDMVYTDVKGSLVATMA